MPVSCLYKYTLNALLRLFYKVPINVRNILCEDFKLKKRKKVSCLFDSSAICYSVCFAVTGARCSSVVRAFAHGAMGRRIDPSWGGPVELFLVPASAPRLV